MLIYIYSIHIPPNCRFLPQWDKHISLFTATGFGQAPRLHDLRTQLHGTQARLKIPDPCVGESRLSCRSWRADCVESGFTIPPCLWFQITHPLQPLQPLHPLPSAHPHPTVSNTEHPGIVAQGQPSDRFAPFESSRTFVLESSPSAEVKSFKIV